MQQQHALASEPDPAVVGREMDETPQIVGRRKWGEWEAIHVEIIDNSI